MLKNFEELEGYFDELENIVSEADAVVSQMEKCQERKNLDSDCSLTGLETLKTIWDTQDLSLDDTVSRLREIISEIRTIMSKMRNIMSYIDAVNTSVIYGVFEPISHLSEIQKIQ